MKQILDSTEEPANYLEEKCTEPTVHSTLNCDYSAAKSVTLRP